MAAKKTVVKAKPKATKPSGKPIVKPNPVKPTKKPKVEKVPVKVKVEVATGKTKTTSKPAKEKKSKPHWEEQQLEPQFQGPAPETLSPEAKTDLLMKWNNLATQVATIKPLLDEELNVRRQVFEAFFSAIKKEGTLYHDLAAGWQLKAVYQIDRKFDVPAMAPVMPLLRPNGEFADHAKFVEAYNALIARLVKWEPKLVTEEFRNLSPENHKLIDQCLISKPKSVSIELVPPKAKG